MKNKKTTGKVIKLQDKFVLQLKNFRTDIMYNIGECLQDIASYINTDDEEENKYLEKLKEALDQYKNVQMLIDNTLDNLEYIKELLED